MHEWQAVAEKRCQAPQNFTLRYEEPSGLSGRKYMMGLRLTASTFWSLSFAAKDLD